jgi:predicted phosphoribosyltransferase
LIYADRFDAGEKLALELAEYRSQSPLILALPRGGVAVAAPIAQALNAPLDLILVRKIGVPAQPELAMGAVVDGPEPYVVRNEDIVSLAGISEEEFKQICERELAEIERRRRLYLKDRVRAEAKDRVVIVVDDGIATGATTRAALQAIRKQTPRKLVLAVPVAPTSTLEELSGEADEIVCLESHEPFYAISFYYADFHQVTDEEVIETLSRAQAPGAAEEDKASLSLVAILKHISRDRPKATPDLHLAQTSGANLTFESQPPRARNQMSNSKAPLESEGY